MSSASLPRENPERRAPRGGGWRLAGSEQATGGRSSTVLESAYRNLKKKRKGSYGHNDTSRHQLGVTTLPRTTRAARRRREGAREVWSVARPGWMMDGWREYYHFGNAAPSWRESRRWRPWPRSDRRSLWNLSFCLEPKLCRCTPPSHTAPHRLARGVRPWSAVLTRACKPPWPDVVRQSSRHTATRCGGWRRCANGMEWSGSTCRPASFYRPSARARLLLSSS